MLINEKAANKYLCVGPDQCGKQRPGPSQVRYCVGPDCQMAWRWAKKEYHVPGKVKTVNGYCGLAGSPE